MSRVHYLKTEEPYLADVASGNKPFEVRKNDRGYAVGDVLVLGPVEPSAVPSSDPHVVARITYLLLGGRFGIASDHCVLGLDGVFVVPGRPIFTQPNTGGAER